jgi:hypothetical protein
MWLGLDIGNGFLADFLLLFLFWLFKTTDHVCDYIPGLKHQLKIP